LIWNISKGIVLSNEYSYRKLLPSRIALNTTMADPVSQVFTLSHPEAALVATIKQILDEDAVETVVFRWGEQYRSERLTSATDELKAEISKRHRVSCMKQ
jgi:hypothetical protein